MIRKLQRRFILITMVSVISIFILILAVLNISVSYSAMQRGYATLQDYAMRDTADVIKALDTPDRNWFDNMRVLYVAYDSKGNIEDFSAGGNPDMTEAALLSMASSALQQSKEKGRLGSYLYLLSETEDGTCPYFLDYGMEKSMSLRLLRICLYVGLLGIVLIFIPVFFLSRWITKPVQTAFDKQKQFIADASHGDKKYFWSAIQEMESLQRTRSIFSNVSTEAKPHGTGNTAATALALPLQALLSPSTKDSLP